MKSRVEEIFHIVADLPLHARARCFDDLDVDPETRAEVEDLAKFDLPSTSSLNNNICELAHDALARMESDGMQCGPYRLSCLLGRGGMGAVYAADRVDGEVSQRVAVKLLRPGANAPQLRERFLAERQILANLSHPNIAGLLDAGHREDGQPYLVMEYVEGQPLDEYTAGVDARQKVSLFLKVCSAVGYLHQNLVVHRDLKPANILVTPEGEPKLLDFGIAKLLDLTTDSNATSMPLLTPDYASPEQVAGCPVSTGTDIYSLGAVLYKLLTGISPHQFENDSAGAIVLAISTGTITPPSRLAPGLSTDLEFVLMKALRREPQERYPTIEQFADDLENYLQSRPVHAREGDLWYRTRKYLRRYWLPAAATALVIASLAAGLIATNRQRVVAERRFGQLRQLAQKIIDLDGAIRTLPGSVGARQRLVSVSLEYLEGLSREARGDMDLALETAEGYSRMARIQGVNAEFNLGDPVKAEISLRKADALIELVLASKPGNRTAIFRSAVVAHDRMILAETEERRDETLVYARRTVDRIEALLRTEDPRHPRGPEGFLTAADAGQSERSVVAGFYGNVALTYVNEHMYAEGVRCARRAVEIGRDVPDSQISVAKGLSILANALRYQGDLNSALTTIREAKAISETANYSTGAERFFISFGLLFREGLILGEEEAVSFDRPGEAVQVLGKALEGAEEAARKDPRDSASRTRAASAARELGKVLADRNPARALEVYDVGIRRLGEEPNHLKADRDRSVLLARSSYPLRHLGRRFEAKTRIDQAYAILRRTKDYPAEHLRFGSPAYTAGCALADYEADTGDPRHAIEIYERLLKQVMEPNPDVLGDLRETPKLSRLYSTLTVLYDKTGERAKASETRSLRVELWRHWEGKLPENNYVRMQLEAARRS